MARPPSTPSQQQPPDAPQPALDHGREARDWQLHRHAPTPTDRELADAALDWMVRLPPALRPRRLAERFPRVVNLIAESWTHPQRWSNTFDSLLCDQRGGREGFPSEVLVELKGLRRYREGLSR